MTRTVVSRVDHPIACILSVLLLLAVTIPFAVMAEQPEQERTPYASLADILEDEEARERLIRELRQLSVAEKSEPAPDRIRLFGADPDDPSLARQIANTSQAVAQGVVEEFSAAMAGFRAIRDSEVAVDWRAVAVEAMNLGLVIAATVVLFLLLRRLVRPLFARASAWAQREDTGIPLLRRAVAVIGSLAVDLLVVLISWVGGYLVALFAIGEFGVMDARESLFLNAFLLVEVFKALIRLVFASRDDGLRLLPLSAEVAAYWNAWLARLSGFIGYGILLVVPMVSHNLSPAVGRLVAVLIMAVAFLYALTIILQNRDLVAERLNTRAMNARYAFTRVWLGMLARTWHLLAIAYFAMLGIVTMLRPEDALPFVLQATLQTVVAIGIGMGLAVLMTRIISRQIHIPDETRQRFPMLEHRLNAFVPTALKVMRIAILVTVIAVVLDAWGVFNLGAWITSDAGLGFIATVVTVTLIVVAAAALWIGLASWIEHRLNPEPGTHEPTARERTLLTIFRNAVAVTLVVLTLMIVLAEIGINIGPLIAGAGVLGLAIGFGAQKLVQDIITGVFIQLENAINTGDVVTAGGVTGTAEKLTIRSLGIRDLSGTYHMIPFSSVDSVSNYNREFAYHVGEYGVAYREDTDEVITHMRAAFDELKAHEEHGQKIIGDLEVHGVTALADSSVKVRVRIMTLPGLQWAIGREYNRLVKRHFDAAGIEIPYPHMTLYFGQDKDGSAPAAPIRIERPSDQERESEQTGQDSVQPKRARSNPKFKGDFDDED